MTSISLQIGNITACRLALGTWALGGGKDWGDTQEVAAQEVLSAALESGINLIDTAPIYGAGISEERIGRAIKSCRRTVLLASKCGISLQGGRPDHDLRPDSIVAECEASLRRLQTDYIDLYQIHWPDAKVPLADALDTLLRLKEQGKIRALGVCNFSLKQLQEACRLTTIVSVQGPVSLLDPSALGIVDFCREKQLSFWAYGALGGGILSGKYKQAPNLRRCDARRYFYPYYYGAGFEKAVSVAGRVKTWAAQKQLPASAVALSWVLHQAGVSGVLAGARSIEQVRQNCQALQVQLSTQEQTFLYGKFSRD